MRVVASTPNPEPVPGAIRGVLDAVSTDDLRDVVESLAVPRVHGTPGNEVVRRLIIDLLSASDVSRLGIEEDEESNVIVGDPRRARVLVGAHHDAVAGTPGADDNASAVAVMLAAARALRGRRRAEPLLHDGRGQATGRQLDDRRGRGRPGLRAAEGVGRRPLL